MAAVPNPATSSSTSQIPRFHASVKNGVERYPSASGSTPPRRCTSSVASCCSTSSTSSCVTIPTSRPWSSTTGLGDQRQQQLDLCRIHVFQERHPVVGRHLFEQGRQVLFVERGHQLHLPGQSQKLEHFDAALQARVREDVPAFGGRESLQVF